MVWAMNSTKVSQLRPCVRRCELNEPVLTIPAFACLILHAALAKLAKRDSEKMSDDAVLEELKISSKDVEVKALSGEWI